MEGTRAGLAVEYSQVQTTNRVRRRIMKRAFLVAAVATAIVGATVKGAEVGPISIGVHLIPSVEAAEEVRPWDMSLSLGVGITLDGSNRFELHAVTDSQLTSLGMTALYYGRLTDRLTAGTGITILWPLGEGQTLLKPLLEAFAHATTEYWLGPIFRGEFGLSFPLLTAAYRLDEWRIIPLAELPSLSAAGEVDLADDAAFQAQLTLQPVIVDTTLLQRPIGRVGDNLLVLPSISALLRFMP